MSCLLETFGKNFPDCVSQACLIKFQNLSKTGKPKDEGEWTIVACFLKLTNQKDLEVVALGTGSKCIGSSHLSPKGDILHDSHAEVIARRAFILYLITQIEKAVSGKESIFICNKKGNFDLIPGVSFHFFVSHTPCGDASIFPKQMWISDHYGEEIKASVEQEIGLIPINVGCDRNINSLKSKYNSTEVEEPPLKKLKNECNTESHCPIEQVQCKIMNDEQCEIADSFINNCGEERNVNTQTHKLDEYCDIYRTGAKCVTGEEKDPQEPGANYHVTGVLRTKPGRGDPSLSMSCSDKIFKWTILGVQGALLMLFLEKPIYMESITISHCPYSQEAMERAIFRRFRDRLNKIELPSQYRVVTPQIFQSRLEFPFSRSAKTKDCSDADKVKPSFNTIIWSATSIHLGKHEVAVNGYKLGATKKALGTPKSWVSICRQALLKRFLSLMDNKSKEVAREIDNKTYGELKQLAKSYYEAFDVLRDSVLKNWTSKPPYTKTFLVENAK